MVPVPLEVVLKRVAVELHRVIGSGDNWKLIIHGGRGGDVLVEMQRVYRLQAQPPAEPGTDKDLS